MNNYLFRRLNAREDSIDGKVVQVNFPSSIGKDLLGINYQNAKPKWWIEGSSDAITPKRNSGVINLITSSELKRTDGSKYIAVGFREGEGEVFHFVSHLIAQKIRKDDARDKQNAQAFLQQTNTKLSGGKTKNISFAGIETTYTLMNTVLELIRKNPILGGKK